MSEAIIAKIRAGHYKSKAPYNIERAPVDDDAMTVRQAREHIIEQARLRREQHRLYREDEARLRSIFQADLEAEHGLIAHPKAQKLFEMAWEDEHSGGLEPVAWRYAELAELLS